MSVVRGSFEWQVRSEVIGVVIGFVGEQNGSLKQVPYGGGCCSGAGGIPCLHSHFMTKRRLSSRASFLCGTQFIWTTRYLEPDRGVVYRTMVSLILWYRSSLRVCGITR